MVRSKVKYELIADERARKESYRKRKLGLFKKLNELKILCNIEACAVVCNGNGTQPEFWPSQLEALHVFETFKKLPSSSKIDNMVNGEGFLKKDLSRLTKHIDKERWKVQLLEQELLLDKSLIDEILLNETNRDDLQKLHCLLEKKVQMVDRIIAEHKPSSSKYPGTEMGGN